MPADICYYLHDGLHYLPQLPFTTVNLRTMLLRREPDTACNTACSARCRAPGHAFAVVPGVQPSAATLPRRPHYLPPRFAALLPLLLPARTRTRCCHCHSLPLPFAGRADDDGCHYLRDVDLPGRARVAYLPPRLDIATTACRIAIYRARAAVVVRTATFWIRPCCCHAFAFAATRDALNLLYIFYLLNLSLNLHCTRFILLPFP